MDKIDKESNFQVKDKRHFNADGTSREEDQPEPEKTQDIPSREGKVNSDSKTLPEIDFSTFILSLASSIQINLGLMAHPMAGKAQVNLVAAKQTIDILGMLEAKTKNNLTSEEEAILKQVLFELRMQYVECLNKSQK
jgi:hypothetical protein